MKKKLLIPVLCILMMLIGGFATWAYFTSQDSVTNTFTVGDIEITMDEAAVTPYGKEVAGEDRVQNNEYHLIPGHSYVKDPTIHVAANSEDCYLFIAVKNDIEDVEANEEGLLDTIEEQMTQINGWRDAEITIDGYKVYYRKTIVEKGEGVHDVAIFNNFKIDGEVDNDELATYATDDEKTSNLITIKAYAVQADGFHTGETDLVNKDEAIKAWTAAYEQFK